MKMMAVDTTTSKATGLALFISNRPTKGETPHMLQGERESKGMGGGEGGEEREEEGARRGRRGEREGGREGESSPERGGEKEGAGDVRGEGE